MLIPRHSLVCFIFSPRYARLAADVSQQAASLRWYRGSCSWVAVLTQPQQIGVPYKVSTFSALPGPPFFLRGGKVKGPECNLCNLFHRKEKLCNIHIFPPRNSSVGLAQCRRAMHDSTRRSVTKQKLQETSLNLAHFVDKILDLLPWFPLITKNYI